MFGTRLVGDGRTGFDADSCCITCSLPANARGIAQEPLFADEALRDSPREQEAVQHTLVLNQHGVGFANRDTSVLDIDAAHEIALDRREELQRLLERTVPDEFHPAHRQSE